MPEERWFRIEKNGKGLLRQQQHKKNYKPHHKEKLKTITRENNKKKQK